MMEESVAALPEAEYRRVWDRFYQEFSFQPSMSSLKWPAIKEPAASVTWSLATLPDKPDYERLDRLVKVVQQGLASCIGPQGTLFALDWQHTSYRFTPQEVGGPGQPAWPLSPYPTVTTTSTFRKTSAWAASGILGKSPSACSVRYSSTPYQRRSIKFLGRRSAGPAR